MAKPCPNCGGTGRVTRIGSDGKPRQYTCPVCNGRKTI